MSHNHIQKVERSILLYDPFVFDPVVANNTNKTSVFKSDRIQQANKRTIKQLKMLDDLSIYVFFANINLLRLYVPRKDITPKAITIISVVMLLVMGIVSVTYTTLYFQTTHLVYDCTVGNGTSASNGYIAPVCSCMNATSQSYPIYSFFNSTMYSLINVPSTNTTAYAPLSALAQVESIPISDCINPSELTTVYVNETNTPVFLEATGNPIKHRTMFLYECIGTVCVLNPYYSPIYISVVSVTDPAVTTYEVMLTIQPTVPQVQCCGFKPEPLSTSLISIVGTIGGLCSIIAVIFGLITQLISRFIKVEQKGLTESFVVSSLSTVV